MKKTLYNKTKITYLINWSEDIEFRNIYLTQEERLLLDFHVTSSNTKSLINYDTSTKDFLNGIRSKWILYKTNKDVK